MHKVFTLSNSELSASRAKFRLNEIVQAILVSILITAVYYYWFAIADRDYLFLYGHFGWGPFHSITAGRYWMTGLVLSSFIALFYTLFNLLLRLIFLVMKKNYSLPSWKHIWLISQPAIVAGVPLIIMNVSYPVMPFSITLMCITAASAGLGLGLYTSEMFMRDAKKFLIISLDGLGLVPPLILIPALGLPAKGILTMPLAIVLSSGSVIFSFAWLMSISFVYKRRGIIPGRGYEILLFACFYSYLVLPMLHYLFATPPGRPYITASDNFFPDSFYLKILTWTVVFLTVFFISKLRAKILISNH